MTDQTGDAGSRALLVEIEALPVSDAEFLRLFFKTLADEDRLKIAGLLAIKPRNFRELTSETGIRPRDIARHIQQLLDAGLILVDGGHNTPAYRIHSSFIREMKSRTLKCSDEVKFSRVDPVTDEEHAVLTAFLRDGKLTALPAQQKRREILFRWLVGQFECERLYPESEINATLKQIHPDFALLRRELVDRGYMTRNHGMYIRRCRDST